jgi:hypothetical protein
MYLAKRLVSVSRGGLGRAKTSSLGDKFQPQLSKVQGDAKICMAATGFANFIHFYERPITRTALAIFRSSAKVLIQLGLT